MSIYGCVLCIPSKNVGFPLNYSRLEKDPCVLRLLHLQVDSLPLSHLRSLSDEQFMVAFPGPSVLLILYFERKREWGSVCVCVCVYVCVCEKWYLLLLGDLCALYPDSIWRLGISLPSLTKDFSIQDSFHAVTQVGQCLHGLSVCACFRCFQSFISLKLVNLILGKAAHEGGLLVLIKVIVKKEIH